MNRVKPPFPKAKKIVHQVTHHGDSLTDHYHWLRDSRWPKEIDAEILSYLSAENDYYHAVMQPFSRQEECIYQELIGKIELADESVPIKKDDFFYYSRTNGDSNYPIFCRKWESLDSSEQIYLDMNTLAAGKTFFSYNAIAISPDHQKVAYSTDTTGAERFTIQIKDLDQNTLLKDQITDVINSIVWHENGEGFFYCKLNKHWRPDQIFYHQLNTPVENDVLIFKEKDPKYRLQISKSASKRYIFIGSYAKENSEIYFIDFNDMKFVPHILAKRTENHRYLVDHIHHDFFILTNDTGKNFRLVKTATDNPYQTSWQEIIPSSSSDYLKKLVLYRDYFAVESREHGLEKIKLYSYDNIQNPETIQFRDPTYSASLVTTPVDSEGARIIYSSLNVPETTLEYHFQSKKLRTLKVKEIPSGYDSTLYQSERVFAQNIDGIKIPISLVYKKSLFKKNGTNPLYLYGYGSYGLGMAASFHPTVIALLDRGFVYAIAHVRGGDEMGYEWYESAKLLTKKRTFTDFIAVTEYLIQEDYTQKENIVIVGGSAGGLLIGACVNERPDLYKAAIAHVPFVDVLNTMLDDSLPLTPLEFKEWGNPAEENFYHYIKSYSPYDNIKAQKYPAMYVTAGISDPRVTYWEPAKWVAKLRDMKIDDNLLLLETNMDAGHAGASGRFGHLREIAKEYNFIFMVFSIS